MVILDSPFLSVRVVPGIDFGSELLDQDLGRCLWRGAGGDSVYIMPSTQQPADTVGRLFDAYSLYGQVKQSPDQRSEPESVVLSGVVLRHFDLVSDSCRQPGIQPVLWSRPCITENIQRYATQRILCTSSMVRHSSHGKNSEPFHRRLRPFGLTAPADVLLLCHHALGIGRYIGCSHSHLPVYGLSCDLATGILRLHSTELPCCCAKHQAY